MLEIWKEHKGNWKQIFSMAKMEETRSYKGSLLGPVWGILKPLITLLMFWFVFKIGLRFGDDVHNVPRFAFMFVGFVPWFFMKDAIKDGAKCLRRNSFLISKIAYPVSTIMTFTIMGKLRVHLILTVCMFAYLIGIGIMPSVYCLQWIFYFLAMVLFFLALSWTTSLFCAFCRDIEHVIDSCMQALFWMSGVIWNLYDIEYHWLQVVMLLNPINFFVNGYRKAFLYHEFFWENSLELSIFAIELIAVILIGAYNYRRLRKELPDVL